MSTAAFHATIRIAHSGANRGPAKITMLPAVSDARCFARPGIEHYGFVPMNLPPDSNFMATMHAADERIPVEPPHSGTEAVSMALQRMAVRRFRSADL